MKLKAKQDLQINVGGHTCVFNKNVKAGEEFDCIPTEDGIKVDFGNGDVVPPLDNIEEIRKYFDLVD